MKQDILDGLKAQFSGIIFAPKLDEFAARVVSTFVADDAEKTVASLVRGWGGDTESPAFMTYRHRGDGAFSVVRIWR